MNLSHLTIRGGVRPPGGSGVVGHFAAPEYDIRAEGQWVVVSKGDDAIALPVGQCVCGVVKPAEKRKDSLRGPMRRGNRGGNLKGHAEDCECVLCEAYDLEHGAPRRLCFSVDCNGEAGPDKGHRYCPECRAKQHEENAVTYRVCLICQDPIPKGKPPAQMTCGRACAAKWRAQRRRDA